jgi:hypothetical protein
MVRKRNFKLLLISGVFRIAGSVSNCISIPRLPSLSLRASSVSHRTWNRGRDGGVLTLQDGVFCSIFVSAQADHCAWQNLNVCQLCQVCLVTVTSHSCTALHILFTVYFKSELESCFHIGFQLCIIRVPESGSNFRSSSPSEIAAECQSRRR